MISIIIFFFLIIFWGCQIYKKGCYNKALSYESTTVIKGICSLEIMIGHIGLELSNELILYPFRKAGVLIVGMFFFLSGYGLMYSLKNKNNYLKQFIKKRLLIILLPVGLVCTISLVVHLILARNGTINFSDIFMQVVSSINWFVWEIIVYYLLFYLLFKKFSITIAQRMILLITIFLIFLCYICGMENPWYGSNLCFPLGILIANNQELFEKWSKKNKFIKTTFLICLLFISIVLFYILPDHNIIGSIIGRNIAAVCFTIFVIIILFKIKIGNKLTKYLGSISFEIFLIHPLVIYFFHSSIINIKSNLLYAWLVIIISLFLSCLIKQIDQRLKSNILNK